jgi:hypothetical protein
MHEHDLDLIAALADGSLADDTEALALIESCPECRAEYEGQLTIVRLLASTPAAEMTDLERAGLHRDLWTELRATPTRSSSSPWWYRWGYAAAGLFVLVGLVAVLNGGLWLGAGDTAETAESFSDMATDEGGGEVPLAGVPEDGSAERATTTAAAAAESLPYPFADLAEEARAKRHSADFSSLSGGDEDSQDCLERLGVEGQQVVDRLDLDQVYLVLMPADDEGSGTVTFVALRECRIAYVDG